MELLNPSQRKYFLEFIKSLSPDSDCMIITSTPYSQDSVYYCTTNSSQEVLTKLADMFKEQINATDS